MKKLLALVLALVMTMSLVTISNAAFSDADKIDHKEAVEVMNALGVINGMPDGSFAPAGNVTRAEMAKMISIIALGNIDAAAFIGTTTDLKDIAGHWAEGYIKYCYSQGVISGRGNGLFDPNANVTAVEAAKMLLVAIGYNAGVQGYVGNDWQINIIRDAQTSKFFDDLSVNANKVLTRDEAAQMIYNAVQAKMIVKTPVLNVTTGTLQYEYRASDTKTLLSETFEAKTFIGTFVGNQKSGAASVKGEIDVDGKLDTDSGATRDAYFPSELAISNIGEEVKVIFKDGKGGTANTPDKKDTIYGVYNTGATKVIKTTVDKVNDTYSDGKLKIDGTKYTTLAGAYYTNYINTSGAGTAVAADGWNALNADNGNTVKFILNDDGKVVKAYVTTTVLSYVTAVNNEKVTISGLGSIKLADNEIYSGIAKNDFVTYTKLYDTNTADAYVVVEKAATIEGKVEGHKVKTATSTDSLTVNGTTYPVYNKAAMIATAVDNTSGLAYIQDTDIGETVKLYMVNGYVGRVEKVSDSLSNYALVIDLNSGKLGSTFDSAKVELLLADGTKKNVTLHEDSVIYSTADHGTNAADKIGKNVAIYGGNKLDKGSLVKYAALSDTVYKIEEIGDYAQNTSGGDFQIYDKDRKVVATNTTPDWVVASGDAPLFVLNNNDGKYYVWNVRSLNDVSVANNKWFATVTDGGKVVAAYAELASRPSGASGNTFSGIVASVDGVVKVDNEYYNKYTIANSTGTKLALVKSGTLAKGNIVTFDLAANDIYEMSAFAVANTSSALWVKEYNESDKTLTVWQNISGSQAAGYTGEDAKTYALDDKCTISYVNANDKKGGDEIGINSFDGVTGYRNVVLVEDATTHKLTDIIVESSLSADILGFSGYTITVNGTASAYPVGATVTVASLSLPAQYTVSGYPGGTWTSESNEPGTSFTMPSADITIAGKYAITNHNSTVSGLSDTYKSEDDKSATGTYGETVTLTISKPSGNADVSRTLDVLVNGTKVGQVTTNASGAIVTANNADKVTFTMPAAAVNVTFSVVAP